MRWQVLELLAKCVFSLVVIWKRNLNLAEAFMNVSSQIDGNKTVHRGQRGSWAHAAVLRYNNGIGRVGDSLNDFYQIDIGRKSTEYFRSVCDIFQTSNGGIIPINLICRCFWCSCKKILCLYRTLWCKINKITYNSEDIIQIQCNIEDMNISMILSCCSQKTDNAVYDDLLFYSIL